MATALNNLSIVLQRLGRYAQAVPLLERAPALAQAADTPELYARH